MRNGHRRSLSNHRLGIRIVLFACATSAGAHAGLVPAHLREEPPLGIAFIVAVVLLVAGGYAIATRPGDPRTAGALAVLLSGLMLAYAASRTSGLPLLAPDREAVDSVGVATNALEGLGLAFALWLGRPAERNRRSLTPQEVSR